MRGFIDVSTLVTLVPVLVVMLVLGLLAGLIMRVVGLSLPFAGFLTLVTASPIIGRFAMAARDGQLDAGFVTARADRGAVLGFVARHAVLCVAWGLPFTLVAHLLLKPDESDLSVLGLALPSGGTALGLLLLGAGAVVAQLLSLLIATKTDSIGQAVSGGAWRWVLVERRADLVPLVAALIGGILVFAMFAWPALGLVALLLGKGAPKLGRAIAFFAYASPGLAAPVLLGRLCGAFVFGEEPMAAAPEGAVPTRMPTSPSGVRPLAVMPSGPSTVNPAVQAARRLDVKQALDGVRLKAASDLPAALKEAEVLREAYPANPQVAMELARLLRQAGQEQEALAAAAIGIKVAFSAGTAPLAVELWKLCAEARDGLELDLATLEALGRQLTTRKELDDAAWCFRTMKAKGADAIRVQKGLIAVAETCARDGNPRGAIQLYRFILGEFPQSTLRDYLESAIAQLDLKVAGARR
ncbi:MAG TPA: hypothetical protein VN914_09775 [Polyangia bacterium]|nr:hypothetical protein [Polyangia bacterium]